MAVQQLSPLTLSDEERAELKSLTMRRKTAQALALRARIVLTCAEGGQNKEVAAKLGLPEEVMLPRLLLRTDPERTVQTSEGTRATRAVDDQTALVRSVDTQIATLQQNVIRATVRASRAARSVAATSDNGAAQLAALEAKRTAEYARLDTLKADLGHLNRDRNRAIRQAVDSSPDRKPKRDDFLGRLTAFANILHESWLRIVVVAALEAIAFGIEVAPVLSIGLQI